MGFFRKTFEKFAESAIVSFLMKGSVPYVIAMLVGGGGCWSIYQAEMAGKLPYLDGWVPRVLGTGDRSIATERPDVPVPEPSPPVPPVPRTPPTTLPPPPPEPVKPAPPPPPGVTLDLMGG